MRRRMFFNKKTNNTILLFHFNNDFKYIGKNVGPVTWGGDHMSQANLIKPLNSTVPL